MSKKREVREKRTLCGDHYMEIDLIPLYDKGKKPRADPAQESTVIQKNLNGKNSKRLFYRKALANFGPDDYMITCNYSDQYLPATMEEAEREACNYIRRIHDHMIKKKCGPLKYMFVTECTIRKSGKHKGCFHVHHHFLISGGLDRTYIESLWRRPRKKGEATGERIGYADSKQLYFNENGIEGLMVYFFGEEKTTSQAEAGVIREKGKRRWRGSKNLVPPPPPKTNDTKWSNSQVEKIAEQIQKTGYVDTAFWEKKYPGYHFSKCTPEYNEFTGRWSIYLRMHRRI